MYNLTKSKVISILLVCLLGVFYSIPNFLPNKADLPTWWQPVNLGLDLQGGSNLLLEVDINNVVKERMLTTEDSIRQILRENRMRYQKLSASDEKVSVVIENATSRAKAKDLIAATDTDLDVVEEDDSLVAFYSEIALRQLKAKVVDQSIEIVRRRIDELGTKEPIIARQGEDRIIVQLPGVQNPEEVKTLLGKTAKMTFHLVDESGKGLTSRTVLGEMGEPYQVTRKALISGEHLVDSQPSFQEGQPVVSFKFNAIGGSKFAEITSKNVGSRLAIVLDDQVISAPTIQGPIMGGSGVITGSFSVKSANDLSLLLRSGALPAPLTVLEERTVGAGLGADSIKAGAIACAIGFVAVILFMILAYGLFGIFTTAAVMVNLFLLLGALSFMGSTLTLPGIAGIILTIGMAVDANVLIFERMRETVKTGKKPKEAAQIGFSEAIRTIIDSNLTTLAAAFVLFYFGTGPVRGFAVTLSVGILTSMFTSVSFSRLMIATWILKSKPKKLPIE